MKPPPCLPVILLCLAATLRAADDDVAAATRTRVGDPAPAVSGTAVTGETYTLAALHGKVVVLSLFATWCGPCNEEMPRMEKELWLPYRARGLVVLAAAREEGADKLRPFAAKLGLTFPLLPDPDRAIFSRFATAYIPRLYVIGADGRIKYQSMGYVPEEFQRAVAAVEQELARAAGG